jgi:hypothetical protein
MKKHDLKAAFSSNCRLPFCSQCIRI